MALCKVKTAVTAPSAQKVFIANVSDLPVWPHSFYFMYYMYEYETCACSKCMFFYYILLLLSLFYVHISPSRLIYNIAHINWNLSPSVHFRQLLSVESLTSIYGSQPRTPMHSFGPLRRIVDSLSARSHIIIRAALAIFNDTKENN